MNNRETLRSFSWYEYHKGFYNDGNPEDALFQIQYSDFFELPEDDEFPYDTAHPLLCGSCHIFALSLQKILSYNPYIIEGTSKRGFHAFCQIRQGKKIYYVDARGITSSFDEFMDVAKTFVTDEYVIRPVNQNDINEWAQDNKYDAEAYAFAEAVITKYKECYLL